MEENNPKKRNYLIPIIVVGILILVLVFIGIYKYIKENNNINVYYNALDNLSSHLIKIIDDNNILNNSSSGNIKLMVDTNDSELKSIGNILNKLDINYDNTLDYSKKISDMNYEINYNNQKITNLKVLIDNDNGYINLDGLYDKTIKLADTSFNDYWNLGNLNNYKIIIKEMTKIIKDNLKEEYFRKEKDIKTDVTNYILDINKDEINNYIDNIYNSMLYNNKLINALSLVMNKSIDEVKENIKNKKDNREEYSSDLVINTYIDKDNKVKKILINSDEVITIELVEDKTYDIKYRIDDEDEKIGNLKIDENNYKIDLEYEDKKIVGMIDNNLGFNIKFMDNEEVYSISNQKNDNNNGEMVIDIDYDGNKYSLTFTYKVSDMKEIQKIDTSNYIESSMLTSKEFLIIMGNISTNNGAKELISDIQNSNLDSLIFNSYGSGTGDV